MVSSWKMLISEKGGNSSFPFSLERWDIIHHPSRSILHESHRTHRTLRTVITYNALVSSLATPKQPRWRWVLMYLEDMQVGWRIWMRCTHEDVSIWRTRWIQDDPSLLLYVSTGQTNCDRYHHIQCGYECMWKRGRSGPGHGCLLGIFLVMQRGSPCIP